MKISNLVSEIDLSLGQILVGDQVLKLAPGQNDALLALVAAQMPIASATKVVKRKAQQTSEPDVETAPKSAFDVDKSRSDKQRVLWQARAKRVAEGYCAFCTKKHLANLSFCKKHYALKYPKKPEVTSDGVAV